MVFTPERSIQILTPPLENGDRLARDEFERRYAGMPEDCKAQLIEGIVYMSAALRFQSHAKPHSLMNTWLGVYQALTEGVEIADAPTVRLDEYNAPQPDIALFLESKMGGQVTLSEDDCDDYIEGAPELLVEISASTVSIDLGSKKNAYERNGVQEYIVWRVLDQEIDWFRLEAGCYVDLLPDADGILRSRRFPGLWLDLTALLAGNMKQVLQSLQTGIDSNSQC